jgi:hypothetical protein
MQELRYCGEQNQQEQRIDQKMTVANFTRIKSRGGKKYVSRGEFRKRKERLNTKNCRDSRDGRLSISSRIGHLN